MKGHGWHPFEMKTLGWDGQLVVNWMIGGSLKGFQLLHSLACMGMPKLWGGQLGLVSMPRACDPFPYNTSLTSVEREYNQGSFGM